MFSFVTMSILGAPLFLWIYLVGFLSHMILVSRRWVRQGLSWQRCGVAYLMVFGLCIVGGKTYDLVDNFFYYRHNPAAFLSLRGHGWNGVFIFMTLGLLLLFRLWKRPVLRFLDSYALYLPVGIAIGRIGCLLTADGDYGTPTTLPWGMTFKYGYLPTEVPVHPTPLYEIIVMLLLFLVLRRLVADRMSDGWVLTTYLLVYAVERFLTEFIRWNKDFALGLTLPQWACLLYLVTGIIMAVMLHRRDSSQRQDSAGRGEESPDAGCP